MTGDVAVAHNSHTHAPVPVSVVIPVYNGAETIGKMLSSLELQNSTDFEVVIVDNGSTDATVDCVRRFSHEAGVPIRLVSCSTPGIAHARNVGASAAAGGKLLFLDADDTVTPNYVGLLAEALDVADAVGARIDLSRNPADARRARAPLTQESALPRAPFRWSYACALGVRREMFDSVGGFPLVATRGAEDVAIGCLLSIAGATWLFVDQAAVFYRLRTGLPQVFRQGLNYGFAGALIEPWLAINCPNSQRRASFASALSGWSGTMRLVVSWRDRGDRYRGVFTAGRKLGTLKGWYLSRRALSTVAANGHEERRATE